MKASVQYGIVVIGVLTLRVRESASVVVRLYRPGYDLVEIGPWEGTNRVEWKPTADLLAQKNAIDTLFPGKQEAGSTSKTHREALLFGASEYERLAQLPCSDEKRETLAKSAKDMRTLAAE